MRAAFVTGGVAYHRGLTDPGEPLHGFETVEVRQLAEIDLNRFDMILVPRSCDGDALYARRYQFARFLDHGGVLIAFGEQWSNWFPGCRWAGECAEDILAPVLITGHPLTDGFTPSELHWHPARERWCCHGHFDAPEGAEVLVANARGDAWLYVDRVSSNGVIVASSNLDPDTHAFHGSDVARRFLMRLIDWARAEAEGAAARRGRVPRKIAGLYSGVHFQHAFYTDPEFAGAFSMLPVWELGATELDDYSALWIPRESNQDVLVAEREKLEGYLRRGGTVVCFDEVNRPWLPVGEWRFEKAHLDDIHLSSHPMVAGLAPEQVRWHSHGVYRVGPDAEVLIDDGHGNVLLFIDARSYPGRVVAGTLDPDCHAGFGTEQTRPLLRAMLDWLRETQVAEIQPSERSSTIGISTN